MSWFMISEDGISWFVSFDVGDFLLHQNEPFPLNEIAKHSIFCQSKRFPFPHGNVKYKIDWIINTFCKKLFKKKNISATYNDNCCDS